MPFNCTANVSSVTIETCPSPEAASMQTNWILIILSVLLTMGLLIVVQSQYQLKRILDSKIETMEVALEKSSDDYQSKDLFKTAVEKLLAQGQKHVDDMEAALNKLSSETEQKKAENDACQEKMVTSLPGFFFWFYIMQTLNVNRDTSLISANVTACIGKRYFPFVLPHICAELNLRGETIFIYFTYA